MIKKTLSMMAAALLMIAPLSSTSYAEGQEKQEVTVNAEAQEQNAAAVKIENQDQNAAAVKIENQDQNAAAVNAEVQEQYKVMGLCETISGDKSGAYRQVNIMPYDTQHVLYITKEKENRSKPTVTRKYLMDKAVLAAMQEVFYKHNMLSWHNFKDAKVKDGVASHSYAFYFDKISNCYFSSQSYPEAYAYGLEELQAVLEQYKEKLVPLRARLLVPKKEAGDSYYIPNRDGVGLYACSYVRPWFAYKIVNDTTEAIKYDDRPTIVRLEVEESEDEVDATANAVEEKVETENASAEKTPKHKKEAASAADKVETESDATEAAPVVVKKVAKVIYSAENAPVAMRKVEGKSEAEGIIKLPENLEAGLYELRVGGYTYEFEITQANG